MIICQTPFRISFFGGGTDWPEYFKTGRGAVLGSAIDRYVYHSVMQFHSHFFDYCIRLAYRKVECVKSIDEIEHKPFREILKTFGIRRDIEINLAADLPSFSGVGTSSSFVVGLINALSAFQGRFVGREDLAYRAIGMERDLLREAVGCQDQVFAAFGGLNVVEFYKTDNIVVSRVVISSQRLEELEASLMLYFTGITRKAATIESNKIARLVNNRHRMDAMLRMVDRGHEILAGSGPLSEFGGLLDDAWREKRQLSDDVSTPHVDAMYSLAKESGAIGAKLLGAGGGGFMLLFVPPERQPIVRERFKDFCEVSFHLNAPGSRILHS